MFSDLENGRSSVLNGHDYMRFGHGSGVASKHFAVGNAPPLNGRQWKEHDRCLSEAVRRPVFHEPKEKQVGDEYQTVGCGPRAVATFVMEDAESRIICSPTLVLWPLPRPTRMSSASSQPMGNELIRYGLETRD